MLLPAMAKADAPAIRTSDTNRVADCATPGRLMAYLKSRNEGLDPRFEKIAVEYMRHGEQLGLRWDYTFFQMMLETGNLSFRGDRGRRGDVKPSQHNFAGLGATGHGAPGESFPDVSTGVLAHLQHVMVYAGETVESPVAERTRKVQEWGILKNMQKRARGSVTFAHLATKWANGGDYFSNIESIASRFRDSFCNRPDAHPEWVQEARGGSAQPAAVAEAAKPSERISGADLARRAIAEGKAEGDERRQGLGATALAGSPKSVAATPSYSILNAPRETPAAETDTATAAPAAEAAPVEPRPGKAGKALPRQADKSPPFAVASAAASLVPAAPSKPQASAPAVGAPAAPGKCRVWTASYGGQKALIIRVKTSSGTDFTVLDVNEGAERREAEAYISAYAKGGEVEAEFQSQAQALDKAFELCPEG